MKHVFLINPRAGKRDQTARLGGAEAIARALAETGEPVRIYACGGDGTVHEAANGIAGYENAAMTVIPTGTGNDFLKNFGPDAAKFSDPENLWDGPDFPLDLIDCNGRYCLTIACSGIDARIADSVHRYGGLLSGRGSYLLSVAVNFLFKPIGRRWRVELDGEVISAPKVNQAITGGQGYIEGNFTAESAQQLAMLIQSGALPLDIEQIEVRTISATLGEDALSTSMTAAVIGVLLVIVFMLVIYRLPGVMASLALLIYILIDLFLLAVIPGVQLTLPGIAGIVLSIGMAVDANVIIFERMKEEMRAGKTVRASVESGFKRAFSAILDSNITTIIAGLVLMIFGAGTIKGFAITLTIGVVCSMFTAVVVTRFLLRQMVGLNFTNHRLYGVRDAKEGKA